MTTKRTRVMFVSYAHEDALLPQRLEVVLKPLLRKDRLELWFDQQIVAGRSWNEEIERNLARAELAVLFISADFLASDYIFAVELPKLTERDVPLVCVPVGECAWQEVELLREPQWALPPERPLAHMSPSERDGALMKVYGAIVELCGQLDKSEPERLNDAAPPAAIELVTARPGELLGVPALPPNYLDRPADLAALKERLLASAAGEQRTSIVGLVGQGGVGKSVIAAALCHDTQVRGWFPNGIYWVTLGESADLVSRQRALARHLGDEGTFTNLLDGLKTLQRLLAGRRALLVVDDVWSTADAQAFAATTGEGRILVTTRDPSILTEIKADGQTVEVLDRAASLRFLEDAVAPLAEDERPMVERLVTQTGGVILALSLVGAMARAGRGWAEMVADLEDLDRIFRAHPFADVFKTMRMAVDSLDADDARRYRLLAVFPDDVSVPESTVARLWGADPAPTLSRLTTAGLITCTGARVSFHDLQRAFALFDANEPRSLLHRQLLDAHRPPQGWSHLPDDEPYLWDHLTHHLAMAGERRQLAALVTNGRWLVRRLHRDGVFAAERDVARAAAAQPQDVGVADVLSMLRRWAPLFTRGMGVASVAATVVSRLPETEQQARELLGPAWFQPVWPLPEPAAALLRTLAGHNNTVETVAFGRNGRSLASGGWDNTVRLWDLASGSELRVMAGHTDWVHSVAFSPDGTRLASCAWDGSWRLWDTNTGIELRAFFGHEGSLHSVSFSPDGRRVASAGWDRTVRIWDTDTGETVRTVSHQGPVQGVAYSPDGRRLVSGGWDNMVRIWDAESGAELLAIAGHDGTVEAVVFSPDGRMVASASGDHTVRLWDAATGAPLKVLAGHTGLVAALAFGPGGDTLATASWDNTVRMWDCRSGAEIHLLVGHTNWVQGVAISPDGKTLASGSWDNTVRLWDPATGAALRTLARHTNWVHSVAFSPDGRTIASAGWDRTVRLWDAATGVERRAFSGHAGAVQAVAFSPDGRTLASASSDDTVRLWDPVGGGQPRVLSGHVGSVQAVAFAPSGRTMATGSEDFSVRIWDVDSGVPTTRFDGHVSSVEAVAFAPDGRTLASAGSDGTVRLWDLATGVEVHCLSGHTNWVQAVAFSADGRMVASGAWDNTVRVWDVESGTELRTLVGHTGPIGAVGFGPEGALASVGRDATVRLWNPLDGTEVAALRLDNAMLSLAWAPDGERLAVSFGSEVTVLQLRTAATP